MIKGVNKQVLEINEPQNGFFEKALFFVKPEYSGMGEGRLKESAKKEIENAGKPPLRSYKYKNDRIKNQGIGKLRFPDRFFIPASNHSCA